MLKESFSSSLSIFSNLLYLLKLNKDMLTKCPVTLWGGGARPVQALAASLWGHFLGPLIFPQAPEG